jgi:hypothetical protein
MLSTNLRRLSRLTALLALLLTGLAIGCGPTDEDSDPPTVQVDTGQADTGTADTSGSDTQSDPDTTQDEELCGDELAEAAIAPADGTSKATVNSTEEMTGYTTTVEIPWGDDAGAKPYTYLRLLKGTSVPLTDAEALEDPNWDMALRGATFRVNGGISGPGGVRAAAVEAKAFADVTGDDAPATLYKDKLAKQCAQASSASTLLSTAIGQWWSDQSSRQSPTPADKTYLVKRVDGDLIKLRIQKAEIAGQTATLTLRWAALDQGPDCDVDQLRRNALNPTDAVSTGTVSSTDGVLSVDASAGGMSAATGNPYVYIDLDQAQKVDVTDPSALTDQSWDLAIKRVVLRVNGGDSGSGGVTMAPRSAKELSAVTMVPDKQFFRTDQFLDEEKCEVIRGPINNPQTAVGKWYSYNTNTHMLEPSDTVYVVETTEGAHVKLKIQSYSDGQYKIAWKKM